MKRFLIVLLALLIANSAYAEFPAVRNDSNSTVIIASNGQPGQVSVDRYGTQQCTIRDASGTAVASLPVSNATGLSGIGAGSVAAFPIGVDTAETASTSTVIVATAHVARAGDWLVFYGGTAGNINVWSPVGSVTANSITLLNALPATPANGDNFRIFRPVPVVAGGSANSYSLMANLDQGYQLSNATGILKLEDAASASGDAGVAVFGTYQSTPTQSAGTVGDYSNLITDLIGALWTHPAPNQDAASTLITCAGCTTTQTGSDQTNYSGKCAWVVLDMTNVGTGSVTLEIDGKDTVSGKYVALLTGAAVTTNSTNTYTICPGLTAAANSVANMFLPKTWRVKVTANNANAATYTVGASIVN